MHNGDDDAGADGPPGRGNKPAVYGERQTSRVHSALEVIDQKLKEADSFDLIERLVWLRGELIKQNERIETGKQKRRVESLAEWSKTVGRIAAMAIGAALLVQGNQIAGMFLIGIGVYFIAPTFAGRFFSTLTGKEE